MKKEFFLKVNYRRHTDPSQTGGCMNEVKESELYNITDKIENIISDYLKAEKKKNHIDDDYNRMVIDTWNLQVVE